MKIFSVARTTAWLVIGHAVLGGLFWCLLSIPESNLWTLAGSAVVTLLMLAVAAEVEMAAAVVARPDGTWTEALHERGVAGPVFLLALLVVSVLWWLTGRATGWMRVHGGEIDAWLMLRTGWTRTAPLHRAIDWAFIFVRYAVALSLAAGVLTAGARDGVKAAFRGGWLRAGLSPARLATVTASWGLLIALPWWLADWRPRHLPPTWVEPAFVTTKLLAVYLLVNLGWAVILRIASRPSTDIRPKPTRTTSGG